jgi:hypothetical protein
MGCGCYSCAARGLSTKCRCGADYWRGEMDEFGGGFLRNAIIGFALALAFSIIYVWYSR